jgi:hypothetical protein
VQATAHPAHAGQWGVRRSGHNHQPAASESAALHERSAGRCCC